jgi:hypothetical protein
MILNQKTLIRLHYHIKCCILFKKNILKNNPYGNRFNEKDQLRKLFDRRSF